MTRISLATKEGVITYVGSLWQSKIFQDSHRDPNGYIRKLVERFAEVPRFFHSMTNKDVEYSHFASYWNSIPLRPWYTNPVINDLYYVHEMAHALEMMVDGWYNPADSWNRWYTKMTFAEFQASMLTEVYIYFEMPGLREQSFKHDIWADRFLNDAWCQKHYQDRDDSRPERSGQEQVIKYLMSARKQAMTSPNPFDFLEKQIADYIDGNLEWARIWQHGRHLVEPHMKAFMEIAKTDRQEAVKMHEEWMAEQEAAGDGIPFYKEAVEFTKYYTESRKKTGNIRLEA